MQRQMQLRQMQRMTNTFPSLASLRLAALCLGLLASLAMADWARADDGYQNEVMKDNPILYYQFNEDPGAPQVMDSSGTLNTDGSEKHSQYLGTRSSRRSTDAGFALTPGQGIILGGIGPVGRMVEFNDPDNWKSTVGNPDGSGPDPGGYIETGLHHNFGPLGPNPNGSVTPVGWSVEFLYRDDFLQPGDNNTESLAIQSFDSEGVETVGTASIDFPGGTNGSLVIATDERQNPATGAFKPEIETFYGGGRTYASQSAGASPIVEGQWQHIVVTFEQSSERIRWYVNGVMTNNQVAGGGFPNPADTDTPILLGATSFYFERQYFDGWMDEFAVYDYRLDDPNNDKDLSDSRVLPHFEELDLWTGLAGGFDGDSDVDGADFLRWQRGESSGRLVNGDLNPDELTAWEANFGQDAALAVAASESVPEPASWLLVAVMSGTALGVWRRRQRSVALE